MSHGAIVLANGPVPSRVKLDRFWPGWDDGVEHVVAADGGARHAERLGLRVDRWVGDGDSVPAAAVVRLEAAGVPMDRVPEEKDESDTELAVLAALREGAETVILLGCLGGPRIDHEVANLALLAHPALAGHQAWAYDERPSRISLLACTGDGADGSGSPADRSYDGAIGDLVSLLPIGGDVEGVRTEGLRYPLADEPLALGPARGLSNVRTAPVARVALRSGRLLVIETPATLRA